MAIAFECPGCGKRFKVDDDRAGRKGKCPSCDTTFQIPAAGDTASAKRQPRVEDDYAEDDPPEDDYQEERPRKRRKKKKKASSTGLIVGLVGGALALLLIVGVVVWLLVRSTGSSTVADDLKFLPDNSILIAVINADKLTTSELYKRIRQETKLLNNFDQLSLGDFAQELEDAQRITVGQAVGDSVGVVVIRSKKVLNLKDIAAKSKSKLSQEEEYGRYTVRHDGLQGVAVVDRKTAVSGPVLTLKKILERAGTKASLSPVLESAFKELDFAKPLAVAMDLRAAFAANQQGQPGGGFPFPQGGVNPNNVPESVIGHLELGATANLNVNISCRGAQEAEELRKQIEAILALFKGPIRPPNLPREVAELAKNTQVAVHDKKVNLTLNLDNNTLVEAAKQVPAAPKP